MLLHELEISTRGYVNFSNLGQIFASLDSSIEKEKMEMNATYTRMLPGSHLFEGKIKRESGEASISFVRQIKGKQILYKNFSVNAGILENGSAVKVVPMNLFDAELRKTLETYFSRVDLVGPLRLTTFFPTTEDWVNSQVKLSFDGARIVSKKFPRDQVMLKGSAILASGSLELKGMTTRFDNLFLSSTGNMLLKPEHPFVDSYKLEILAGISNKKPFMIDSKRLKNSLGLTHTPDFNKIELLGDDLFKLTLDSSGRKNMIRTGFDKFRFFRRKKPLWARDVNLRIDLGKMNLIKSELPENLKCEGSLNLFGFKIDAEAGLNLVKKEYTKLLLKGNGENFNVLLDAIKTQPEGKKLLKNYPVKANGKFSFALTGKGSFYSPEMGGWLKFPLLSLVVKNFILSMPFDLLFKKLNENDYLAEIEAKKAYAKYMGRKFSFNNAATKLKVLNLFNNKGLKLDIDSQGSVFSTWLKAKGTMDLKDSSLKNFRVSLSTSKIGKFAEEIAKAGKFKLPFSLGGKFNAYSTLSGKFSALNSNGKVKVSRIALDFPISGNGQSAVLKARDFSGELGFSKQGNQRMKFSLKSVKGKILDANITAKGEAVLKNLNAGLKPYLNNLEADFSGLNCSVLFKFLASGIIPTELISLIEINDGRLNGRIKLSGNPNKLKTKGNVDLINGKMRYKALKTGISEIFAGLNFEGRTDSGYARIGLERFKAKFGRTVIKIPEGFIEDPVKTGKIFLKGKVSAIYPADLLNLMGGLSVSSISFPEEGYLAGDIEIDGTLFKPFFNARLTNTKMLLKYASEGVEYSVPIGRNSFDLRYDLYSGNFFLKQGQIALLGGKINLDPIRGRFSAYEPFRFQLSGKVEGIDVGKFKMSDSDSFKGIIDGDFEAKWDMAGKRDALFKLKFKNIFIPKIPIVEEKTINKIGLEFIKKPDFRVGQLNFYVTSEEVAGFAGKLQVADGLFAGPHMRLELDSSEFDPMNLKLHGKLMLNPQSLRKTTLGKKLRKLSVTVQDRKTGIPYIDLALSGQWNKPELISRSLEKRVTRRAKRNFIGRIFGRHRPHKASVEELMKWFPGWRKGL
jgi:hypothetical protein